MASKVLALPAFAVVVLGVGIALAHRTFGPYATVPAIVLLALLGWLSGKIGAERLLPGHPVAAVWALHVWAIMPSIAAAVAIALIIYLNATLDPETVGMSGADKEMMKTVLGALSALLTAQFIKQMDNADEELIGERVKAAFRAKFLDSRKAVPTNAYPVVVGESPVEEWAHAHVVNGQSGWGWGIRLLRARKIAEAMAHSAEQARVAALRRPPAATTPAPEAPPAIEATSSSQAAPTDQA